MTKKTSRSRRKLSREILGLLAISFLVAFILFEFLSHGGIGIAQSFLFVRDITLTDAQSADLDDWILHLSLLVSVGFFVFLFLFLLGERLSYIRDILKGIDALQAGQEDHIVPVEGSNELTQLAEAVNYLSATQRQVKEQERALSEEKEQLIRSLSHDIRTPLTSIMAYSELLSQKEDWTKEEQAEYLALIQKKAGQIKSLTDILLDGSKRSPEHFDDARLLMEQLAVEFEELLEDTFPVSVNLAGLPVFSGTFDVQELQRIFDNLVSNIRKYADPAKPVLLSIGLAESRLVIRQENHIRQQHEPSESYQIGLKSIRRIAHNYGGQIDVQQDNAHFAIVITLSEI